MARIVLAVQGDKASAAMVLAKIDQNLSFVWEVLVAMSQNFSIHRISYVG